MLFSRVLPERVKPSVRSGARGSKNRKFKLKDEKIVGYKVNMLVTFVLEEI